MKPAPFSYVRAHTAAEAVELLRANDGEARLLAGGQSLMPMLSMRLVRPAVVIDINRIAKLGDIAGEPGVLRIGALVRYSTIERSDVVARRVPLLSRAVRFVGDRQIRNRGTLGGSLAQGDPSGEIPLASMTLDASVTLLGPEGSREVAVEELYLGPYTTVLEPDEMITEVRFSDTSGDVCALVEHARRHGDFAVIAVAAVGVPADGGGWRRLNLGVAGMGPRPYVVRATSLDLGESTFSPESIGTLVSDCRALSEPGSDVRASAEYRSHLLPIYVERALRSLQEQRAVDD